MMRYVAVIVVTVALFVPSAASAVAADTSSPYVGAERCKICHMAQYRHWRSTGMATAWNRVKDDSRAAEVCARCHATAATPALPNVQCEACHGPGRAHMAVPAADKPGRRASINRDAPTCASCHEGEAPEGHAERTPQTRPGRFHAAPDSAAASAGR